MIITTTGTTDYGKAVIDLLDPKRELFSVIVGREKQLLAYEVDTHLSAINDPVLAKATLKRFEKADSKLDLCFAFDDNSRVWR